MVSSSSKTAKSVCASTGSKAPSTGCSAPISMDVDSPKSKDIHSSMALDAMASDPLDDEQELTEFDSRISRLPSTVPSASNLISSSQPDVAIPPFQNTTTSSTSGQDVYFLVNNSTSSITSTVPKPSGNPSHPLETTVSSFPQPITQHGLSHPIRRPRTSSVFQSSKDLAAHYGIPQVLPPTPRASTRTAPSQPKPSTSSALAQFQALSANYLTMLSTQPTDNSVAAPASIMQPTAAPAPVEAPTAAENEALQEIAAILGKQRTASASPDSVTHIVGSALSAASPEFNDMNSFDNVDSYMTSPLVPDLDDFGFSPEETPYQDFLSTPLFDNNDDELLTSPYNHDLPLFSMVGDYEEAVAPHKIHEHVIDAPYTISPESPALHSFDDFRQTSPKRSVAKPAPRRQSRPTGIRKGITPDTLLDEDAPTQSRKYATPSATSKKEVPATFARKRARSEAFGDDEDQLHEELPPNPTEKDLIEAKRRQNTVAARRSRKRKLEQYQNMEKSRDEERRLKEIWQERANVLLSVVRSMGVNYEDFPADVPEFSHA